MAIQLKQFGHIPKWVILVSIGFTILPIFFDEIQQYYIDDLAWFLLLVPCFIFSYYLGLKGGLYASIIVNITHLAWYLIGKFWRIEEILNEELTLNTGVGVITFVCSIAVGFLSEKLKKQQCELQALNKKLETMAMYDSLTGLPNRIYFRDKLANILEKEESVSLMFIDLDGFKNVNDNYGHDEGDLVLKDVANRLSQFKDGQTFISRLGGDEFTVILNGFDKEHSLIKAKHILTELQMTYKQVSLSASIGIAISQQGDRPSTLMKHADIAMYNAKTSGKNDISLFCFSSSPSLSSYVN